MNIDASACAVLTLLRERKILSLDCSLSTFNTLTFSVPMDRISFGIVFLRSPPTLTNVTIPVTPSDPIPEEEREEMRKVAVTKLLAQSYVYDNKK